MEIAVVVLIVVLILLAGVVLTLPVLWLGRVLARRRGRKFIPEHVRAHGGRFVGLTAKFVPYMGGLYDVRYTGADHREIKARCLLFGRDVYWLGTPPGLSA